MKVNQWKRRTEQGLSEPSLWRSQTPLARPRNAHQVGGVTDLGWRASKCLYVHGNEVSSSIDHARQRKKPFKVATIPRMSHARLDCLGYRLNPLDYPGNVVGEAHSLA